MSKKYYLTVIITLIISLLVIGKPSERRFLHHVASEYGSAHHGFNLNADNLAQIGATKYHSYILFSTYTYAFGNISVSYAGIGFLIFKTNSSMKSTREDAQPEILI